MSGPFFTAEEQALADQFVGDGYVVAPVEDQAALVRIRDLVATLAAKHLGMEAPEDKGAYLDAIHTFVQPENLNSLRLAVINGMNNEDWLRPAYFSLVRQSLAILVGNEMAMQRRINLSIQMPHDDSSLLPVHADVWSGDSAFETVVWLPMVDCFNTKSMYLMPPAPDAALQTKLSSFKKKSAEDIFAAIKDDVRWMNVPFGSALIFCQNLMHGNRINLESETRWSMNCRFKGLFTPYAEKKLGEFFEPITLRPVTRLGMNYQLPGGFND